MGINASQSKNAKSMAKGEPIEAGTYPARLVQVVDIGLQPQRAYQGEEKPPAYEVLTTYELLDEFMKDEEGNELKDKPRWMTERFPLYPLTSDKAKSTKRYLAIDPEAKHGGDWGALIEIPVMLTVTKEPGQGKNAGKVYNNIAGVAPMRPKDAARAPELVNPTVVFDLDTATVEAFKALAPWLQKVIMEGLEFKGTALAATLGGDYTPSSTKEEKAIKTASATKEADEDEQPF